MQYFMKLKKRLFESLTCLEFFLFCDVVTYLFQVRLEVHFFRALMKRKTTQMVSSKSFFFLRLQWCGPRSAASATSISLSILDPSQRQHANQLAQHGNDLFPLSLLGSSGLVQNIMASAGPLMQHHGGPLETSLVIGTEFSWASHPSTIPVV